MSDAHPPTTSEGERMELRRLIAEASPLPWRAAGNEVFCAFSRSAPVKAGGAVALPIGDTAEEAMFNRDLIVASVSLAPRLLAENEAMRGLVKTLGEALIVNMPMAKGYAYERKVGANMDKIEMGVNAIEEYRAFLSASATGEGET